MLEGKHSRSTVSKKLLFITSDNMSTMSTEEHLTAPELKTWNDIGLCETRFIFQYFRAK